MSTSRTIEEAFAQRPDLCQRVLDATAKAKELGSLFEDIALYITQVQKTSLQQPTQSQQQPLSKKRKLDPNPNGTGEWANGSFQTFTDISFSIPQRKKLRLDLGKQPDQGVRALTTGGDIEFEIRWSDVRDVVCLPLPEKAQAQYNFCIFSTEHDGISSEQYVWTVPEASPKAGSLEPEMVSQMNETYRVIMLRMINDVLKRYKKRVVEPSDHEFSSQVVQAHRKGEKAFHVKAFRGAKDGFLFFLSNGIVWGFKKPLEFFSFDSIHAVSYTSVLQRTFNLNIAARASADVEPQEYEFSMVDQADFAGINGYVKRHGLQDASMAEQRRAKTLNINGGKAEKDDQGGEEEVEGELQKAAREAQDLEDEEEEDDENFDPGSEGESEGEGSSSGEDEFANSGQVDEHFTVDELGSENEDVDG